MTTAKEMLEMAGEEGVLLKDLWAAGVALSLNAMIRNDEVWVVDNVAFSRNVAVAKSSAPTAGSSVSPQSRP